VLWWPPAGGEITKSGNQEIRKLGKTVKGRVVALDPPREDRWARRTTIAFARPIDARPGDVITWDTWPASIVGDRLYAPGCDDLAGVAAALGAFDSLLGGNSKSGNQEIRKSRNKGQAQAHPAQLRGADIRVLLTRAEEVGFIGAIGACKSRLIPKNARLICLENSKSFADSPIGGGPIVRVGDKTATFDSDLTYRVGQIAQALAAADPKFKWQRKLMPGGTCEATAFVSFGYAATCLCLPLGNYHNMNEATGKIDAETISLSDHDGLIRLLVAIGQSLDDPNQAPPFMARLEGLFAGRKGLLEEGT
jgi:putative aminopeptidase FrvX